MTDFERTYKSDLTQYIKSIGFEIETANLMLLNKSTNEETGNEEYTAENDHNGNDDTNELTIQGDDNSDMKFSIKRDFTNIPLKRLINCNENNENFDINTYRLYNHDDETERILKSCNPHLNSDIEWVVTFFQNSEQSIMDRYKECITMVHDYLFYISNAKIIDNISLFIDDYNNPRENVNVIMPYNRALYNLNGYSLLDTTTLPNEENNLPITEVSKSAIKKNTSPNLTFENFSFNPQVTIGYEYQFTINVYKSFLSPENTENERRKLIVLCKTEGIDQLSNYLKIFDDDYKFIILWEKYIDDFYKLYSTSNYEVYKPWLFIVIYNYYCVKSFFENKYKIGFQYIKDRMILLFRTNKRHITYLFRSSDNFNHFKEFLKQFIIYIDDKNLDIIINVEDNGILHKIKENLRDPNNTLYKNIGTLTRYLAYFMNIQNMIISKKRGKDTQKYEIKGDPVVPEVSDEKKYEPDLMTSLFHQYSTTMPLQDDPLNLNLNLNTTHCYVEFRGFSISLFEHFKHIDDYKKCTAGCDYLYTTLENLNIENKLQNRLSNTTGGKMTKKNRSKKQKKNKTNKQQKIKSRKYKKNKLSC
jgi:hypothetical protein